LRAYANVTARVGIQMRYPQTDTLTRAPPNRGFLLWRLCLSFAVDPDDRSFSDLVHDRALAPMVESWLGQGRPERSKNAANREAPFKL
jgi:hypothetical protein